MIYLNYGTWLTGSPVWCGSPQSFNELSFKERENSKHIAGRDLREVEYRNILSTRQVIELTISADELYQTTKNTFIRNFHKAHFWKYSKTAVTDWATEGIEVVIEDGDIPIEDIENNKNLPEYTVTLTQKNPDA